MYLYLYTSTKGYCNLETWPRAVSEIYIYTKALFFNQDASSQLAIKAKKVFGALKQQERKKIYLRKKGRLTLY